MGTPEVEVEPEVTEEEEIEEETTEETEADLILQRLQEAEARAARLEAEFERQRADDFKRKLEAATPEERIVMELDYERSRRHEAEVKLMRSEIRGQYPLFAGLLEIFGSRFQIEVDDAEELREIAEDIGPQIAALFTEQLSSEKLKVRKEVAKKWKMPGLTSGTSGTPESKTKAQIEFDAVKAQFDKDPTNPVLLQRMIAAKRNLGI